jgi:hypothetical protein
MFIRFQRNLVANNQNIVYVKEKAMRKLTEGSQVLVTPHAYTNAANSARLGDALRLLVPEVFTKEEMMQASVKDLPDLKVSALIGNILFYLLL